YLVGARGTPRHAVILGVTVTVTHTLGVFALGLVTLFASRYILPERLYPILGVTSGLMVCAVGVWLFLSRLRGLSDGHAHHDHSAHDHAHSHGHDHARGHSHSQDHEHEHAHGHTHTHDHEHTPDQPHGHDTHH